MVPWVCRDELSWMHGSNLTVIVVGTAPCGLYNGTHGYVEM